MENLISGVGNDTADRDRGRQHDERRRRQRLDGGGCGNDVMNGSTGNDTMVGGFGGDILIGSVGDDRFDYNSTF